MDSPPFHWPGVSGGAIGAAASAAALHAVGRRFESCIAHHFSIGKWRFNLGSTESRLARYKKGMIYNAGRAGKPVRPFLFIGVWLVRHHAHQIHRSLRIAIIATTTVRLMNTVGKIPMSQPTEQFECQAEGHL